MKIFRLNIISIFILLFSWSIFLSPTFAINLDDPGQHKVSMQLIPCLDETCHLQSSPNCTQHCEVTSVISESFFYKELSLPNSPKLVMDDQRVQQIYTVVELKPPIKNYM